ncbi:hypothetical protein CC80DRAFT_369270, partial [Byssothecium circinans]
IDTQRSKGKFWKNCKECRDKRSTREKERKRRQMSSKHDNSQSPATQKKVSKNPFPRKSRFLQVLPQPRLKLSESVRCAETFLIQDFPSLSQCTHAPEVCLGCMLNWWDTELGDTVWDQIACPTNGCEHLLTHDDVKKYASTEFYDRFDEASIQSMLNKDAEFRYCMAEGCSYGHMHDSSAEGNIFRCNACGFRVCAIHNVPFHTDETCDQYSERIQRENEARAEELRVREEQEKASLAEVSRSSVVSPGPDCGRNIQKTAGCDHMTCATGGCGFQFCYVCRAPYGGSRGIWVIGNSAHASSCSYHEARLP